MEDGPRQWESGRLVEEEALGVDGGEEYEGERLLRAGRLWRFFQEIDEIGRSKEVGCRRGRETCVPDRCFLHAMMCGWPDRGGGG